MVAGARIFSGTPLATIPVTVIVPLWSFTMAAGAYTVPLKFATVLLLQHTKSSAESGAASQTTMLAPSVPDP